MHFWWKPGFQMKIYLGRILKENLYIALLFHSAIYLYNVHNVRSSEGLPLTSIYIIVLLSIRLCIFYCKWYDTYHDKHEAIFDMYQRYILSGFRQKLDISTNFHRNLGILMTNLSKMYCLKYHVSTCKMNDTICIVLPKYRYNWYNAIWYRAIIYKAGTDKTNVTIIQTKPKLFYIMLMLFDVCYCLLHFLHSFCSSTYTYIIIHFLDK